MADATRTNGATERRVVASGIRRWLGSGRLQSESGAYCAWRDAATDSLAFEYPEITGYALTWLASHESLSEDEVKAGRGAATWLVRRLNSGDRAARAEWENGAIYTFDLGMVAAGLLSFGRLVNDDDFVDKGRRVARSLAVYIDEAQELPAVGPDGPASGRAGEWSTGGRAHLVKCVQALLLSDERDAARTIVQQAVSCQQPDGRFTTQPRDEFVMLHPHLYAVEGLWMWGQACDERDALDRAAAGTEWAWRHQLPSGGLPRWASAVGTGPEQLDVTSQAIRAAVLLGLEPPGLQRAVSRLASLARIDGDYGHALVYRPDDPAAHLNSWVSMFAGQALLLAIDGSGALEWHDVV